MQFLRDGHGQQTFLIQSVAFDNFESLRSPIMDSSLEIVQLSPGAVRGSLLKASFGDFAFSRGHFSGSFRPTGSFGQTHLAWDSFWITLA
jgi:hypothetical protein